MNRLVFSHPALARKLQMSRAQFFAFVEGGLDRRFCDRLLAQMLTAPAPTYQVISAKELPGETGGKLRLIALYRTLKQRKCLRLNAFGKTAVCAFFLDKDVDDTTRRALRSEHVVYTKTYDLEGDLFQHGDLARALADASGLTQSQASALLGHQAAWLRSHAQNWIDWTVLCLISQVRQENVGCTYDRASAVNPNLIGATDLNEVAQFKTKLAAKLALNSTQFNRIYNRYHRTISKQIANGSALHHFKGKWLPSILEKEVSTKNNVPDAALQSLGQKVTISLLSQVGNSPNCSCCAPYSARIDNLLNALR